MDKQPDLLSLTFTLNASYWTSDILGTSGGGTLYSDTIYFDEPGGQGTWLDTYQADSDSSDSDYDYDYNYDSDYSSDEGWC